LARVGGRMKIAFGIFRFLVTLIFFPLHIILTLLITGLEIINNVVVVVGSFVGFFVILGGLAMLITEGVSISNVGILVIGVLCVMVPALGLAALETMQNICDAILEFVSGTSAMTE
jgi:hypothetical protein